MHILSETYGKSESSSPVSTLAEQPEQLLELIQAVKLRPLIAIIAMNGETLPGDTRPAWAVRAAIEFWRCCEDVSRSKKASSENYRLGLLWGALGHLAPTLADREPALAATVSPETVNALLHTEMGKAPPEEAADFYEGFAEGLRREQFWPSGPFIIYLILAILWQEISAMKNVTELHQWLETHLGSNLTGTRERIAKICHKIGLRFADKGGRPKTKLRKRSGS